EAIVALGKLEELQAITPIQDCLQDNSPLVRQVAAQVLKQLQEQREKVIGQLLANLLQSTSAIARRNAAHALAEYKDDPRVIEAWLTCLEDKNPVELESTYISGEVADEAGNDDVLGAVVGELWYLGPQLALVEPRAVDRLLALAQNKHSVARRPHAIRALGTLGDPRAVDPLIDVLQEQDLNTFIIGATAGALGALEDARAVEPLIHVLERSQPGEIWSYDFGCVTWALAKLKDCRAIEPLIACLHRSDTFPKERLQIIEALEKLGATEAIEPLITCLQDKSIQVREASARALGTLGDARAFTPLTMALHDQANTVRQKAQVALQKLSTSQQ
ncbi:MAG TPA: HEAT repeat domain-containing protein, partial [Ktedonobacteraceae bacterium]